MKFDKNKMILTSLACVTIIAVAVSVWALFFREPATAPDYTPKQTESNAKKIGDDDSEKLKAQSGGGAVSMTYKKEVTISLSGKNANLLFQNPSKSVNDVVLEVIVIGNDGVETTIAQSGILKPGYKIEKLDLDKKVEKLSEGVYNGKFNVLYYNPTTGEKAIVNGNLDGITINVKP